MRIAIRVNKNNFFEVNELLHNAGYVWCTGEKINEFMSEFLFWFKNFLNEDCLFCTDSNGKFVTHATGLTELKTVNEHLKKRNEETYKIVEIEELKKMLKVR